MKLLLSLAAYGLLFLCACHSPSTLAVTPGRAPSPPQTVPGKRTSVQAPGHGGRPTARSNTSLPRVTREDVKLLYRDTPELKPGDPPKNQLSGIQITAGGKTVELEGPFEECDAAQEFLESECQLMDLTGDGVKDLVVPWTKGHRDWFYTVWVRNRNTGKWVFHDEVSGLVQPEAAPGGGFIQRARSGPMTGEVQTWHWRKNRFVLVHTERIDGTGQSAQ
jgi:hypothetical protein